MSDYTITTEYADASAFSCSWDKKNNCLKEPKPMELITPLPPIHFKPVESKKKATKGMYTCPLYYYPIRSGTR